MKRILGIILSLISAVAVANASSPRYEALADSADNLIKRERWADAEGVILQALKLEPGNFGNALLLSNLGVVQTNQGKIEKALESFGLGLAIAPKASIIYTNRARTLISVGRFTDALSDLDSSLAIDSLQPWPLRMRGLLRLAQDSLPAAKSDFILLTKINPKDAGALEGLARISEKEGNFEDALRLYDEAVAANDTPEARLSRILLTVNMDRFTEASELIRKGLEKWPNEPNFFVMRGYLHRRCHRNSEAEIDKKIALDKGADPQFVDQFIPPTPR